MLLQPLLGAGCDVRTRPTQAASVRRKSQIRQRLNMGMQWLSASPPLSSCRLALTQNVLCGSAADTAELAHGAGQATAEHAAAPARRYLELEPYAPPEWASKLTLVWHCSSAPASQTSLLLSRVISTLCATVARPNEACSFACGTEYTQQAETRGWQHNRRWHSGMLTARCTYLQVPQERFCLGLLPTPMHRFAPPGLPDGVEMWIKRDDLTGMQLSGNKVRRMLIYVHASVATPLLLPLHSGCMVNHSRVMKPRLLPEICQPNTQPDTSATSMVQPFDRFNAESAGAEARIPDSRSAATRARQRHHNRRHPVQPLPVLR